MSWRSATSSQHSAQKHPGLMQRVSIVVRTFVEVLREIFDENAYARFLAEHGMTSSKKAYAQYLRESGLTRERRPRCC
jgi:hypothetical protein